MPRISDLVGKMIEYYSGDPRRIGHFLKVYAFSKCIGEQEGLDPSTQEILETAAVTHDIGIRVSEEKYGSAAGAYQQIEGPPLAREMLLSLGYEQTLTERVCFLIGRHHTYAGIDGTDYRILLEADLLVNLQEENLGPAEAASLKEKVFQTRTGLGYLCAMFPGLPSGR